MNAPLTVLFLIYIAIVMALSFGTSLTIFLVGAICLILLSLVIWASYVKPNGNALAYTPGLCKRSNANYAPVIYFLIIFSLSLLYWLAFFPGGFNLDAYGQWEQAHGVIPYSDWHPILSTLIIQLVCKINDSFEFYILVQLFLFALSVAALLKSLQNIGVNYCILLCLAIYVGISPAIGLNNVCMTKDAQFTIVLVNLYTCFIKIIYSEGDWFRSKGSIVWLSLLSAAATLMKHNGILFIVPAFAVLLIGYRSKIIKMGCALLIATVCVLIVKVPVMSLLNVEPHENVVGESVGVPMAILGNAMVNDQENIPDDVREFLLEIAPIDDWEYYYYIGEWDSCKWEFGDGDLLKDESIANILHYTLETAISCPKTTYQSIRENTRIVWEAVVTNPDWVPTNYIEENDMGISSQAVPLLRGFIENLKSISLLPVISNVVWNTGFGIIAILVIFCIRYRTVETRKILMFLPLFIYDFGTMVLLAGPNQRYFYCNAVLYIPIILVLLIERPNEEKKI